MSAAVSYAIIDINMVTCELLSKAICNCDTLKKSINGTKVIMKFNDIYPDGLAGITKYTYEEMLAYIVANMADWEIVETF